MSKTLYDNKTLNANIVVRKEENLLSIKNRYKIYFYYILLG